MGRSTGGDVGAAIGGYATTLSGRYGTVVGVWRGICADVAPKRLERMRRAVGLGSLTKMSCSILHRFVYMRCRGIEEYIWWLGIPSDCEQNRPR